MIVNVGGIYLTLTGITLSAVPGPVKMFVTHRFFCVLESLNSLFFPFVFLFESKKNNNFIYSKCQEKKLIFF